ncbi:MAG: ImmA/IrrE family metallo-endopeptidase [Clostridia bacterium]|nr:ImmA/IrrE family metallo-endopeptidase [Clostridia bacterium]
MVNSSLDSMYLSPEIVKDLELKANGKIMDLGKSSRIIKEEVFSVIAEHSIFLQYPIEDEELCGFVCPKKGKLFSFVNSFIPFDKQIFAAAHELYHIWFDKDILDQGELIKNDALDLNGTINLNQKKVTANRFAAMFLVPKNVLRDEINKLGLMHDDADLSQIVKLMDIFGVPYKTIVRRLFEIEVIPHDKCLELLSIPDKGELSPVRIAQKRLQLGEEQQRRTMTVRFEGLVDKALSAYEQNKISEEKLEYLLSFARKTPEEFGISKKEYTEEEILAFMENDD